MSASAEIATTFRLPCDGATPGEGCTTFELFYANELCFLEASRELGEEPDALHALLDDPEALRARLYEDFVAHQFCVLALQRRRFPNENVIPIRHDPTITYAGCEQAISFMKVRVHPTAV